MELSESVQRGLQSLADPSAFDQSSYQALVDVSFRSLLSSHADPGVLGELTRDAFVSAAASGSSACVGAAMEPPRCLRDFLCAPARCEMP